MKLKKILNNNAVIVQDGEIEKIAMGSGIAFNKQKNDAVNKAEVEKLFVVEETDKLQQLIARIPEAHFEICEKIISYAEEALGIKLNDHIHISLTDHVSFAIERLQEGVYLQNKLLQEIKVLYKEEFQIGMWAIRYIEEQLEVEMPMDEAGYIALYIHTAKPQSRDMKETVRLTTIVNDLIQTIADYLNLTIDDDISYQRLMTHLRYSITRVEHYEMHTMDDEMLEMIKAKYALAFACSQKVAHVLLHTYGIGLPENELGFIALHVERLRKRSTIIRKD
ncbi:PRD domain-containing protein [Alkalihalobacillus sp. 1P02AB]|uniref:PRD domain-containing protein n=1 Tax=Alkalihalobacillus sp. 1P02AB TaxID=3132260 RepID=UPI0039A40E71